MGRYDDIGLDSRLRASTGLYNRQAVFIDAIKFESMYEVQGRRISASNISLGSGLVRMETGSDGTADFVAGSVLNFNSTVKWKTPKEDQPILGIPYLALYQGAPGTAKTSGNQIWPVRGTNVTVGRFQVQGWFDLLNKTGTTSRFAGNVIDTTGTNTQEITFSGAFQYVDQTAAKTR